MTNPAYALFNLDPFQEMRRLQYDINHLFEGVRGEFPALNIWTGDDGALVTAELPGMTPADLEISVVGESVVLRGARHENEPQGQWLRRERPQGQFVRTLELPFRVNGDKVEVNSPAACSKSACPARRAKSRAKSPSKSTDRAYGAKFNQEVIAMKEIRERNPQPMQSAAQPVPAAPRRLVVPAADICETPDDIRLIADMPGVDEGAVDITLEKNVLILRGAVSWSAPAGHTLGWGEYESGDYERVFNLPDEIDRDNIEADMKDGVLRLRLPKAKFARTRKIAVKAA